MSLIALIVLVFAVAFLVGLVNYFGPQLHFDATILRIGTILAYIIVICLVVAWLLAFFGLGGELTHALRWPDR